jgi:microcystin-dependent protein
MANPIAIPGTNVPSGAGISPGGAQGVQGVTGGQEAVGSVKPWLTAVAPAYWMLADGSAISRTIYPELFALIGTSFGAGDGSTTFNLPDLRSRFILGSGQGASLTNRVLAAIGGEENHQLTIAELASHTHIQNAHNHSIQSNAVGYAGGGYAAKVYCASASADAVGNTTATNQNTGSDTAHNTMPPFLVLTYIVKVSVGSGAAPLADTTQDGLLRKVSGNTTDFVDGTNNSQPLQPVIWSARLRSFNAIGNPNFECTQRNCGATLTNPATNAFIEDRWQMLKTGTMTVNDASGIGSSVVPGTNFQISSRVLSVTLTGQESTLAAGDYLSIIQSIEGPQLRELLGDAHSLSLLVSSTVAPLKFSVGLIGAVGTLKSLVKLCTISSANTTTLIQLPNLPIWPADGTWPVTPGTNPYQLRICLAAGANFIAPVADTWNTGNYLAAPGADNWCSKPVNTTTMWFSFIQHEPGAFCTTLIDKPFTQNLIESQRYYCKSSGYATKACQGNYVGLGTVITAAIARTQIRFPVEMAKVPTIRTTGITTTLGQVYVDISGAVSATASQLSTSGIGGFALSGGSPTLGQTVIGDWDADTGW